MKSKHSPPPLEHWIGYRFSLHRGAARQLRRADVCEPPRSDDAGLAKSRGDCPVSAADGETARAADVVGRLQGRARDRTAGPPRPDPPRRRQDRPSSRQPRPHARRPQGLQRNREICRSGSNGRLPMDSARPSSPGFGVSSTSWTTASRIRSGAGAGRNFSTTEPSEPKRPLHQGCLRLIHPSPRRSIGSCLGRPG